MKDANPDKNHHYLFWKPVETFREMYDRSMVLKGFLK